MSDASKVKKFFQTVNFYSQQKSEKLDFLPKESNATSKEAARKTKDCFEFMKEIGEGSFSTVYLAKDIKSGVFFASKKI